MAAILGRLSLHFPSRNLSEVQARSVIEDFYHDMGQFAAQTVAKASEVYRTDPENRFFPIPGQLIDLARKIPDPGYKLWIASRG
jgi:hypothetical protein